MQLLTGGMQWVYRRGRRALRAAEKRPDGERLHELRKRAKDLWHSAQLLEPAAPKRMKKLARRGHRLSDLLGEDHDLLVLRERAEAQPELLEREELELLRALIDRRRNALEKDALALASRLYSRKPRKLRLS
jgi:CHAD domain-containing protein